MVVVVIVGGVVPCRKFVVGVVVCCGSYDASVGCGGHVHGGGAVFDASVELVVVVVHVYHRQPIRVVSVGGFTLMALGLIAWLCKPEVG